MENGFVFVCWSIFTNRTPLKIWNSSLESNQTQNHYIPYIPFLMLMLGFGKCHEVLRLVMRVKVMAVSVLKSTFGNVRQIMYEVSERMICSHLIPPYSIRPLLIKIKPSSFLLIKILIMEQRAECRRWGSPKWNWERERKRLCMWMCVQPLCQLLFCCETMKWQSGAY